MAEDIAIFRTIVLEEACLADLFAGSFLGRQLDCSYIGFCLCTDPWVYCSRQFKILQPNLHCNHWFARNLLFRLRWICAMCAENNDSYKSYPTSALVVHELLHGNGDLHRVPERNQGQNRLFFSDRRRAVLSA